MNNTIELFSRLPFYFSFRKIGFPILMPFNYTFSTTYKCNSKCKTCNIWKFKNENELSTEEWIKIIKSLGKSPLLITVGGGEPFIRKDLIEIISTIAKNNDPKMITIPTNGLMESDKTIKKILDKLSVKTKLFINFSIDGIKNDNDRIRGIKNSWKRTIMNYRKVDELSKNYPNLIPGVNTVISKWNVKKIEEIYNTLMNEINVNHFITEIAEIRNEMKNHNNLPTPSPKEYQKSIKFLISQIRNDTFRSSDKLTQAFRIEYYKYVRDLQLKKIKPMKSYAGFTSAHITPTGNVWECAIHASDMGNLRNFNYDFKKMWKSEKANQVRKNIKRYHKCLLANEFYSSSIFDFEIAFKIIKNMIL
jgi:MoaA/NifB/PqqE/SkfB family radical SAM enzyme